MRMNMPTKRLDSRAAAASSRAMMFVLFRKPRLAVAAHVWAGAMGRSGDG
jgi:hypothetical protein